MISQLSNILFFIGIFFIGFFLYGIRQLRSRNASLFSIMCLAVAIFVIGYGLELRAENFEQLKVYLKLEYFGAPFMTVFWFLFSYRFYYNKNASFRLTLLIMAVPITTLFLSVTNDYYGLLYKSVNYREFDGFVMAELTRGPWYYFYSLYSYGMIFYGSFLFFKIWRSSVGTMKTQAFLMCFGTTWPVIVNIFYLFGFSPYGLDLTPFGLVVLVICYALGIFKYGVLEIQEIVKELTFAEISEGILVLDRQNRLLDYNRAGGELFSWLDFRHIGMEISQFEWGREILDHEHNPFMLDIEKPEGMRTFEFRVTRLIEKQRDLGDVYFFRDITEQRNVIEKLSLLASYDALSQVYNRRKLLEEAEMEALRAMRYYDHISVLMIDIDRFKKVNDVYGHLAGDEVIRRVAAASKKRVRGIDIVGRYGGEEFVIILSNASQESALHVAEEIRKDIEDMAILYEGQEIRVTVSIGVASIFNDNADINIVKLIDQADAAMYNAKNKGRNQVSL